MGAGLLAAVIVIATAAGVLVRGTAPERHGGLLQYPGTWLVLITALLYVNQLLFTAYVHQVWRGDVWPIAHYLPGGWFALADLGRLADSLPALSWTVLRVQAALELPFVLLAYLMVCRWFGAEVFRRALHARWAVS